MTCPTCGVDRDILKECLNSMDWEDRCVAHYIIENCAYCKEWKEKNDKAS